MVSALGFHPKQWQPFEEHERLSSCSQCVAQWSLMLRWSEVNLVSFIISTKSKIPNATSTNLRQPNSRIGVIKYYRDLFPRRSHVMAPLTNAVSKFNWGAEQQQAFDGMKALIAEACVAMPTPTNHFIFTPMQVAISWVQQLGSERSCKALWSLSENFEKPMPVSFPLRMMKNFWNA